MNNSVILQVDESTKGLMEEIQSGITSSIECGMKDVKDEVIKSVDGNAMILRKFKHFDGLTSSIEQLHSFAEESKKLTAIVSPLGSRVSELKQGYNKQEQILSQASSNITLLVNGVAEFAERQNKLTSDITSEVKSAFNSTLVENKNTKKLLNDILLKITQAEDNHQRISGNITSSLSNIEDSISELKQYFEDKSAKIEDDIHKAFEYQKEFSGKYADNESIHQAFEDKTTSQIEEMSKSLEKLQTTLNIIVNLVTPFWKKWK